MNDYAFGNFLYTLRTEKQLSQTQLAQLLGVTNKAVSKWENGASKPNTNLIPRLAEILGVSVEELFAGKRFEKDAESERIKAYLSKQQKTYGILSSVFLGVMVILPPLMIEFTWIMVGFQLPDEVAGPLGSILLIFAFIASLVAFIIYSGNFRHSRIPGELTLKPAFVKGIRIGILLCVVGLPGLAVATIAIYWLLLDWPSLSVIADVFLAVAVFLLIVMFGLLVCLHRIKRLMKIKVINLAKWKRNAVPFREFPLWLKISTITMVGLFPLVFCLQFSYCIQLKYSISLLWLVSDLVILFYIIGKHDQ